eukprot:8539142-Ditylum_brightwellii.AAC.1
MIASDINSELPFSQDEHTEVLFPGKSNSTQSSNTPLTMPTNQPTEPKVCNEPILMMQKMQSDMDTDFKERQQKHLNYFNNSPSTLSSTVVSNKESLQKIESKLNTMSHNISKFDYQLNKAEKSIFTSKSHQPMHYKSGNACPKQMSFTLILKKIRQSHPQHQASCYGPV